MYSQNISSSLQAFITADCRAEGYEQKASAMNDTLQVPSCEVKIEYSWLS